MPLKNLMYIVSLQTLLDELSHQVLNLTYIDDVTYVYIQTALCCKKTHNHGKIAYTL